MKLSTVSSIVVVTPLVLGASGVALAKDNSVGRVKDILEKTSSEVHANEKQIERLRKVNLLDVVPNKMADDEQSKRGMAFHMLERKRINGCSYKIKMNNREYSLGDVLKAERLMSNPAGRVFLELDATKRGRERGERIIDSACFKSKNITLERHLSSTWKGGHYGGVIGKDENNKEVYRDGFWQR